MRKAEALESSVWGEGEQVAFQVNTSLYAIPYCILRVLGKTLLPEFLSYPRQDTDLNLVTGKLNLHQR
jgi:hypothetical protein